MDDAFRQVEGLKAAGCCAQVCACICALSMCGAWITFMAYLGKFAFGNPDPENVWVTETPNAIDSSVTDYWLSVSVDAPTEEAVGIHDTFVSWFLWGFICEIILPAGFLLGGITTLLSPGLGMCCFGLAGCGKCCGGLAWYIAGIVWRFNAVGRYASGDFEDTEYLLLEPTLIQEKSGKFMGTYYLITWIMMGVMCGCSILAGLGMCIAAMCCK